ncbi:acyltransferase [Mucilaginibacter dorajii]|uniref:Acyltransferase n=1 Tax=Mucilaginibacter dorajii TaxID=692994 RepID=A0ABP7R8J3_9SPHI|nr:acyltransferase [Mucilaginibacter dorajii]MCS3737370.1 acetyltransferase-like isoleucine patch superfamily enzyme [Mucilaginibacter dorajii]
MQKAVKFIKRVNLKTIIFNFRYFPFKTAIKMPVFISNNVFLYKMQGTIKFNCPIKTAMIQIGYGQIGISDFKRTRGIWEVYGEVIFNGRVFIMHGTKIVVGKDAQLVLGDNFTTSTEVSIIAEKRITFGNGSGISWQTQVMDTDFHHIADEHGVVFNQPAEVIIGDKVWIGCRCTILKGVTIPNGCIIAANSLITRKLSGENNIFGGNPTRVLKSNVTWWY